MAVALAVAAAALGDAVPAAGADPGAVTLTARVGEEVGVLLGPEGAVVNVSTVPVRVIRERHGNTVVVTVV